MRTVVIDAPGQIRVDIRPDPVLPGPDGAIIEVDRHRDLRIGSALLGRRLPDIGANRAGS